MARRPEIKVILHYNVSSRSALEHETLSQKRKKRGKKRRDWEGEGDRKEMGEVKERLEQHTKVVFLKDWGS